MACLVNHRSKPSDSVESIKRARSIGMIDIGLPILERIEAAQIRTLVPRAKIVFVNQESTGDIV